MSFECTGNAFANLQPVNLDIMCERNDEFVTDSVDPNRPTHERKVHVRRVLGNEVVGVEVRQARSSNAASDLEHGQLSRAVTNDQETHTVGMWLTYGSCTIVDMVFGTERSANSKYVCSSHIASRSKSKPRICFFRKVRFRVCDTASFVPSKLG